MKTDGRSLVKEEMVYRVLKDQARDSAPRARAVPAGSIVNLKEDSFF